KSEREAIDAVAVEKAENLLRRELEWMRRQPQARGTKTKARIEAFYDLEKKSKSGTKTENVKLSVKMSRQGSQMLGLESNSESFQEETVIDRFAYTFKKGDRTGLAGKNGSGKSTVLNIISLRIVP